MAPPDERSHLVPKQNKKSRMNEELEEFLEPVRGDESHENNQLRQQEGNNGNDSNNRRKKGAIRRFLSNLGHIKRSSWRRQSTNESGLSTETSFTSHGEWDYDAIVNDGDGGSGGDESQGEEENSEQHQDEEVDANVSFLQFFLKTDGPPKIVFLSMLYALALGSTIGVVPAVLTDKYAVLHHGFDDDGGSMTCADYGMHDKPQACIDGSGDAQTAAAGSSFVSNTATFLTSSLIGSLSDEYGRRSEYLCTTFHFSFIIAFRPSQLSFNLFCC